MIQHFKLSHFYFWRMLWGSLRYADWADAFARRGVLGWIVEFLRAITGFSAWPFFVPRSAGWTQAAIQDLLAARGIITWGWGAAGRDFIFHVKMRHAHWAQYLLQEAGVPLNGRLLADSGYAPRRRRPLTRGFQAPKDGYRPMRGQADGPAQPEPVTAAPADPIGRINRLVDRLVDW